MKVRTETTAPNGRSIAVELNDHDGLAAFGFGWEGLGINDQFKKLSAKADSLLVFYMAREHMITPEEARARMAALKEAMG